MDVVSVALATQQAREHTNAVALGQGAVPIPGPPGETPIIWAEENKVYYRYPSQPPTTKILLKEFPLMAAITNAEIQTIITNL